MDMHYKKDGSLDMRYNSSKEAMSSGFGGGSFGYSGGASSFGYSGGANFSRISSGSNPSSSLNRKKDGTLDMRYNSSKAAASSAQSSCTNQSSTASQIHRKKDGTLDMRYTSSKNVMASQTSGIKHYSHGVPRNIPVTKAGIPDMRTSAAKEWVKEQVQNGPDDIPSWIPKTKDGSLDSSKAITQEYLKWKGTSSTNYNPDQRLAYYVEKLEDMLFRRCVQEAREDDVEIPQYQILPETQEIQRHLCSRSARSSIREDDVYNTGSQISESVQAINYRSLSMNPDDKLGQGSFGIVYKATWNRQTVAVKQLHLNKLTRQDKNSFIKEINIMSTLGEHPNLVRLYGYTSEPLCLVMEYVELGTLSYLLHYCEDSEIEAKITDGRIKKKLILGIVLGMIQLHAVSVVHGDLKPQNVLVSKDYTAKITDFGFATLRGKTSSSVASSVTTDDGSRVGGTAAYMAPELLNSSHPPEYSSDVYSFGVMLNEVIHEEEPYSDQYANFAGRGPFAAANYAKLGNRPRMKSGTRSFLKNFIGKCWNHDRRSRPTFQQIFEDLKSARETFPNSFEL